MVVRVVLAEDNYLVREGVGRLISSEPDLELVASCADHDALLQSVDAHRPDVVVTDIRMPPTGTDEGIRAAVVLRDTHPDIGVVLLSQYTEPAYALSFLEGGSKGRAYLLKEKVSNIDQLAEAIREVARGGSVIDPDVVDALVAARSRASDSPLRWLTPRKQRSWPRWRRARTMRLWRRHWRSRNGRWRSTSTPFSRSCPSPRSRTSTDGSRPSWSSSGPTTPDARRC